jgi:hypothetical protein
MSDEQTTSELVRYVRDAADWAIGEGAHEIGHYARRAADRLESLQARVVALEAEIARRDEARPHIEYVRRSLDHYAPSVKKMKARLDHALALTRKETP